MRRVMEIAIIAVLDPSTLQLALGGAFGAGQLVLAVAAAPALFASRSAQFHPTVTAPTAPVSVGWADPQDKKGSDYGFLYCRRGVVPGPACRHSHRVEFDVSFQVTSATAVIEGMDVEFANRNDHNLGRLQVFLSTEVAGPLTNRVIVRANFGLRDWSGGSAGDTLNGDDAIKGMIRYSVFIV